jgi:hypothetical protein
MTTLDQASARAVVTEPWPVAVAVVDAEVGNAGVHSVGSDVKEGAVTVGAGPLSEVAAIRTGAMRLAAHSTGAPSWPVQDRHRILADLDHTVDVLVSVRAAILVAERDAGTWRGSGDRSPEAWWARTSGVGQRAAAAQLRQAGHLDAAPPTIAAAVAEGTIRVEHAAAIGAVVTGGTPAQREAMLSPAGQQELLALAQSQDAGTFATTVAHRAATVDPAGLERDHQAQRRARFLHLSHTPDGTLIKGRLDPIAGHRVGLALEALTPRPGADDDRDHGQRCADALDAMATRTLAADPRPGTHVPVQISFLVTEQTWTAAQADRDHRRARARATTGAGSRPPGRIDASDGTDSTDGVSIRGGKGPMRGSVPGVSIGGASTGAGGVGTADSAGSTGSTGSTHDTTAVSYPPATLEDGTPVPASELAAAMCDCEITRIVLDADSVPLDVGRTQRVFTGPQRRAVIARDRQCAWPDCHIHARWSDVHHIAWWERDTGPTSVDNGILLCSYHHHEVHRQDLTITRIRPADRQGAPGTDPPDSGRVTYEFRDNTGRIVASGAPPGATPSARAAAVCPRDPVRVGHSARPDDEVSRPPSASDATGAPELEWAQDPWTGRRVPACWVTT